MSLPVFFHPGPFDSPLLLSGPEGRHAVTVKRLNPGEKLLLIDGAGGYARAVVQHIFAKGELIADIEETGVAPQPPLRVTVAQALPKAERSELAVDLLTQGGVDAIIPWQAQRCVAKWSGPKVAKGQAKWEAAALAATKQSRRLRLPEIHAPMSTAQLSEVVYNQAPGSVFVLHEEATCSLKEVELPASDLLLIIGPEGGIGEQELGQLSEAGATAVKLGPEVLRTASAGLVALAAIGARTARW